jgi:sigma-B regulation protein RsbU (phosphoserine phosphatase)
MQVAILPSRFPVAPGCDGSARMLPATTMGGDFYDFIELPGGRIGLVMADVSGKGVPAAFFMAVARTNLNALAANASGPADCLQRTNDVLLTQNPMDLFVTVFYAVFDPATGALAYANGGHNPPLIRRANGTVEMLTAAAGLVLGMFPAIYDEDTAQLAPGDTLVLYTDGVTEAFNVDVQMYEEARLIERVRADGGGGAKTLVASIFDSVIGFSGAAPQSDDITVAVLSWAGAA